MWEVHYFTASVTINAPAVTDDRCREAVSGVTLDKADYQTTKTGKADNLLQHGKAFQNVTPANLGS